ncbi:MAG: dioxygenase [Betaproteobacteria bacterium]|nr:dioxygenase [Betaproteobacteria bacterium]
MQRYAIFETAAMLEGLARDGCVFVPAAATPEQCSHARRAIDALEPIHWDETHAIGGRFMDRYLNVFNRDASWLRFLDRPGIIDLAEAALGAECHVIGETAWRSHPGFRGEPLHADYLPLHWSEGSLPDAVRVPIFILTVHFHLSEVTAALAPTRIVPGSHRAGRAPRNAEPDWNGRAAERVLAQAGDALIFRSDLWHGGSDNSSQREIRYLLQVHYGRREMAQHYSPFLEWRFDPRVLATASKRQLRLLGGHEPAAYD